MKNLRKHILLLFFLSGISGLIYEVVWVRMYSRLIGSTNYAISIVLAAFMGGLALGSFIFGKIIDKIARPIKPITINKKQVYDKVFKEVFGEHPELYDKVTHTLKDGEMNVEDEFLTFFMQDNKYTGKDNVIVVWREGKPQFYEVNKTFYKKDFNWKKIKKLIPVSYVLFSDTDPYVDKEYSIEFANKLESSLIEVKDAKHMNTESGFVEFPLILELCKTRLTYNKYINKNK